MSRDVFVFDTGVETHLFGSQHLFVEVLSPKVGVETFFGTQDFQNGSEHFKNGSQQFHFLEGVETHFGGVETPF